MDPNTSAAETMEGGAISLQQQSFDTVVATEDSQQAPFNGVAPPDTLSESQQEQNYDDLFPSLPASSGKDGMSGSEWIKKPMLSSSTVTQVFRIPIEERRDPTRSSCGDLFGWESSDVSLVAVMDKTRTTIEMSASRDQSLTFLICGSPANVVAARKELLVHFQAHAVQQISIPKEHLGAILGKGGSKLQKLENKTATKITIPKTHEDTDVITIRGPKDGVDKAVHEIQILSDMQSKQAYEVLHISKTFHPFINGPNGDFLKSMLAEYPKVRVNIPPPSADKDELSVTGEKDGVLRVVEKIKKLNKDLEKKVSSVSVEVKKSQHRYVIGPKGNSINEIFAETGVFVEMPSSSSASETITLRGPQAKLGFALTKVYEKANSFVCHSIPCPSWLHKFIIGRKGANIQKLTCDLPKVNVAFVGDSPIKVEGPPEEADKAKDLLQDRVDELVKSMAFAEVSVDAKYHKHIIGKGGLTVNKLKQDYEVTISIPDESHGLTVIRIEGSKEGVSSAKKELEQIVEKIRNEKEKDLIIESRFHRQLIGNKGENIQKIRDEHPNVQIGFPDVGNNSDIVKLRGPKAEVDNCAKILSKMHKELLENSYQVKVPIFKQFHRYIIGKGGSTIRKIRTETDTKVDIPDNSSESEVITVTGKKENVIRARDKIQQIQSEMADVMDVDIKVPAKIHNTIIGSGGKLIQSIMNDCGGVHIKFPDANSGSDQVTIRGPKDDVEKAKKILLGLSNERQLASMSAQIRAKPELHKFLIGRQGVNIKSVRDKTGARIVFPNATDEDREVITIFGTKEAVAAAKKELEQRIKDLDNVIEETMSVDPKHHFYFVTKRGEVLRQIGEQYGGVVISFPRMGVNSDKVTLKGAKECVDGARKRIEEFVDDLECQVTMEVEIEQRYHRNILGVRGCNIQKVCLDHDVQVKIPDSNVGATAVQNGTNNGNGNGDHVSECNIIRVTGKKEKCLTAIKALNDLVPVSIEVEVPYEFHPYIIGLKGVGVRKLMEENDVNIRIPAKDQRSSIIVVTGSQSCVDRAKVALLERVQELEHEKADKELRSYEVSFDVNPDYHPKIIGRRGAVIREIREKYDVNIQLPRREDEKNASVITITGYQQNVEDAKKAILKIVHDFEELYKEEVEIDHRVHPIIIGRRGAGIKKIMLDYNVDIKMPREGDPNPDVVMIMGSEDGVLDCKDHLLNILEEFLQEIIEREDLKVYEQAPSRQLQQESDAAKAKQSNKGFEIKGAPWHGASDEAFPSLGGVPTAANTASSPAWGPRPRR